MIAIAKADTQPSWCPGCGNYSILKVLQEVLATGAVDMTKLVLVSGIGQAAKMPHNIPVSIFNGLHGRALPAAAGIKIANCELEVAIFSGDGDMYGEGGNHFLHNLRRNIGIKLFVHNNQVYGLTKARRRPPRISALSRPFRRMGKNCSRLIRWRSRLSKNVPLWRGVSVVPRNISNRPCWRHLPIGAVWRWWIFCSPASVSTI